MTIVFLEKLTVTQLVKKFPTFYGSQRFITMFTKACHWSLAEPNESSPYLSTIFLKDPF
jgi:sulfur relay (sulfurtransferase) DsrC/TusE family protein